MARKKSGTEEPYEDPSLEPSGTAFESPVEPMPGSGIEGEAESALPEVDESLVEVFNAIRTRLIQTGLAPEGVAREAAALEGEGNIVGVGMGVAAPSAMQAAEPGATAVNVYVAEPMTAMQVRGIVTESMGVSASASDDVPLNVIVTGELYAQAFTFRMRPAPGGVSVGHYGITAGTLGCLARGAHAPRDRRLMVLSNNHVLANSNNARSGDSVIQPGAYDGGSSPRDQIAILESWVPIRFDGACNYVDAATAWAWPDRVRPELIYRTSSGLALFRVSGTPVDCAVNMIVGKTGRTTELKAGRIIDCNATVRVNYGGGRQALFCDQMVVQGLSGDFSAGGDSGSLVWRWDSNLNPVGLLFAGGGGYTIANKIRRVLAALDIVLYT